MSWIVSPAMTTTIARQQAIDAIRDGRRHWSARTAADPVDATSRGRHRARRRSKGFLGLHARRGLAG
jgi:hypothetical protein